MKTGMAILLISFILLFTGCGTQAGTETGSSFSSEEQREIPPGEVEALAFLDKLAENKVTPNGRAQGDFKIKYPQWFDKNDKIIYHYCIRSRFTININNLYFRYNRLFFIFIIIIFFSIKNTSFFRITHHYTKSNTTNKQNTNNT